MIVFAAIGKTVLGERFETGHLIGSLREMGSATGAIPLYLLIFGVATTAFTPAVVLMVTAGVTWGFWPGWLIVWVAANVWSNAHFAVGRWVAGDAMRTMLERRGATWLVKEVSQGGLLTTLMVRQLPIPFPLLNLAAGASPLPLRQWLIGNAIGLIPNCMIYTELSAALADGVDGARERALVRVVTVGVLVVGLSLVSRLVQKRLAARLSKP
jgi:uncharacterized membrane protein YdjX (TVP38/TMEM64 family)